MCAHLAERIFQTCSGEGGRNVKSVSIYALTRSQTGDQLQKMEHQLSRRDSFLKIRDWEIGSMKALVGQLEAHMEEIPLLRFFYSFQIPRLGKEFDLLQIKDGQIVNIELKSGAVPDHAIRRQLLQNRYYLSVLGRPIRSYTYISSTNRLVRLNSHDHIVEAEWGTLCQDLMQESADYEGEIEKLFQAELYLISPWSQPERFLKKEYFLTCQQRDIERQILKKIRAEKAGIFSFSGLPGTGKTLLLYDLAMKLSNRQPVCIIHCKEEGEKWSILQKRLQRITFLSADEIETKLSCTSFHAVLVDEAHLLSEEKGKRLLGLCQNCPVIFCGDREDLIAPEELPPNAMTFLENLPEIKRFRLTNRIRINAELSSFLCDMMHLPERKTQKTYPHIAVVYANTDTEAEKLLYAYEKQGYQRANAGEETERLVALLEDFWYYEKTGYLRSGKAETSVRRLFHQLSTAKEELALIVQQNAPLYDTLLDLLG